MGYLCSKTHLTLGLNSWVGYLLPRECCTNMASGNKIAGKRSWNHGEVFCSYFLLQCLFWYPDVWSLSRFMFQHHKDFLFSGEAEKINTFCWKGLLCMWSGEASHRHSSEVQSQGPLGRWNLWPCLIGEGVACGWSDGWWVEWHEKEKEMKNWPGKGMQQFLSYYFLIGMRHSNLIPCQTTGKL